MFTKSDVAHARAAFLAMNEDEDHDGGGEVCMFSFGYGEVWRDGEVIADGAVVFALDDDGDLIDDDGMTDDDDSTDDSVSA